MKIKDIVKLQPLMASVESGFEPSITTLIENYYKPHFPDDYEGLAQNYLRKIEELSEEKGNQIFFVWSCWCDGYHNIDLLLGVFDQESMAVDYAKEYIAGKTFEHDAVVTTGKINEKASVAYRGPYSDILHSFPGEHKEPEDNYE